MYEHGQQSIFRHFAPFPRVWPTPTLKKYRPRPQACKNIYINCIMCRQISWPNQLLKTGLWFYKSPFICSIAFAHFLSKKKRVWISKILRIFLRGQPNVPTQEKHVISVYVTQGFSAGRKKNEREKMKVMQKYWEGKLTLKLCFVFFGLSIHVYSLLLNVHCTCTLYRRKKCFFKKKRFLSEERHNCDWYFLSKTLIKK